MQQDPIVFSIFLVFTGAAVLATLALYARQSLLVAYILLGVLLGPWGAALVPDPEILHQAAHIGIIFLLFLLGLDLQPQDLLHTLRKSTWVVLISSIVFSATGYAIAIAFGFPQRESVLVGAAMMFSSTIIGVKLLPTTALHHQHQGEVIISVLLLQDLVAIVVLLLLEGYERGGALLVELALVALYLPGLLVFAFLFERYVLVRLIERFDKIHEYIFLVAIGWCLGVAQLAEFLGLSAEIGAFIAGVALATSPISQFIVQNLRPLRDFFLVLFFFALGASFDLSMLERILLPALVFAFAAVTLKPIVFRWLFMHTGEKPSLSSEMGVRLGQISEFSILIAVVAYESGYIGVEAFYLIEIAMLMSFAVSSYWVVWRFPTPIALSDRLRRD